MVIYSGYRNCLTTCQKKKFLLQLRNESGYRFPTYVALAEGRHSECACA